MYSVAAVLFIAGAAAAAVYLWQRPTVIEGVVLADEVRAQSQWETLSDIACKDATVGVVTTTFVCTAKSFGEERTLRCTLGATNVPSCELARR